ncbi:hypothetical protein PGB90_002235 [Kerria lacca]
MGSVDYLTDIARTLESFFKGVSIDEITFAIATKDGPIPVIMKMNEDADDEVVSSVDSDLCIIDIPSEVTSQDVSSLITEEAANTKLYNHSIIKNSNPKPVENVLNMVLSNKEKNDINDISEPWQLNILNNEEEDTAIDTITEVMTKNNLKDVGWQCDMCNKTFNRIQNLQEHCREEHNGTGCFECNLCGTRVMTKLSLKRHIRSHSGIKTDACSICGKTFKRSDYLATHYKLHVGARTYQCAVCGKEFTSKTNLTTHEKVHLEQKDYICQQCNKSFTRRDKLRDHMLRHLNIKRFQCSLCDKRYAEKRDLRTHLKIHESSKNSTLIII